MNRNRKILNGLVAGAVVAFAAPVFAASSDLLPLPQPVHEGNVTYITGGIGNDERSDLQSQAKNYNLLITDSNKKGQFTADNDFTITGKDGRELINVSDGGPLLYAKLPPGNYKITATNGSQSEVRNVKISARREDHVHLIWR